MDVRQSAQKSTSRLRDALDRHFALVEENSEEFLGLMHNRASSDPRTRAMTADVRWLNATSLLHAFEAPEPVHPVLRTTIRGWIGYLDEIAMDHLRHHELTRNDLVELATAALVSSLRAARSLDPRIVADPAAIGLPIH
jgi:tetracycline repressor-like protein